MILRWATQDDAVDIWRWRNDPLTRAMSRSQDEVQLESHMAWYARALADPAITLLIGEAGGEKLGMVRFDRGAETEVSINVNPACRGRGVGFALLSRAIAEAQDDLVAEIREDNAASQRIFERAGFVLETESDGRRRYRRPG